MEKSLGGATAPVLERFLKRLQKAADLPGMVTVLITSDDSVREMNRRFRRKNKHTDVLSFPSEANGYAGDIAISAGIAAANARRLGHPVLEEIKILMLHGALHLAGFDHEGDDGEMADKEMELRRRMRLPATLIARADAGPVAGRKAAKPQAARPKAKRLAAAAGKAKR